jgi:hypothetical protein
MYRLLALFATDRFGLIKIRVVSLEQLGAKFGESFTTRCDGARVELRTGRFEGQSRNQVKWQEALALFGAPEMHEEAEATLPSGPVNHTVERGFLRLSDAHHYSAMATPQEGLQVEDVPPLS